MKTPFPLKELQQNPVIKINKIIIINPRCVLFVNRTSSPCFANLIAFINGHDVKLTGNKLSPFSCFCCWWRVPDTFSVLSTVSFSSLSLTVIQKVLKLTTIPMNVPQIRTLFPCRSILGTTHCIFPPSESVPWWVHKTAPNFIFKYSTLSSPLTTYSKGLSLLANSMTNKNCNTFISEKRKSRGNEQSIPRK